MSLIIRSLYQPWTLESIFGADQTEWCPICGARQFEYVDPAGGLYCTNCQAEFKCRMTGGDPGLVVDCLPAGYNRGSFSGHPGRYWLDPADFAKGQIWFSQVLKACNGGLDDRTRWCSSYLSDGCITMNLTSPVGRELFVFVAYQVADAMLYAEWEAHHPMPSDDLNQWMLARGHFVNAQRHELEQRLQRAGAEGYYLREQCAEIIPTPHLSMQRCIPNSGETPMVDYLSTFKPRRGSC